MIPKFWYHTRFLSKVERIVPTNTDGRTAMADGWMVEDVHLCAFAVMASFMPTKVGQTRNANYGQGKDGNLTFRDGLTLT